MRARIYRPARNAMQSGTARTKQWVLEFAPAQARFTEPLMGWTGSADTQTQVRLRFATQAEAEDFAQAHGIDYLVVPPKMRAPNIRPGGYGENFATNRRQVWTH
ncbi:MAG: ETC complex I subunit conserved region [Rhodobacteraceae bacterium HLUCCA12]|nr:MAG: ETC complex I subunit conserved region [Rhodobacteraceae bacterium HLUCCA12]